MGSARALACRGWRPRQPHRRARTSHCLATDLRARSDRRGAGRDTRGRVGSPILSALAACLVLVLASCGQKPIEAPNTLARIGDSIITQEAFQTELERRAQNGSAMGTAAQRQAVLDEMIRVEVFFAKAQAAGLDRDAELLRQFKRTVAARYEETQWQKQSPPKKPEPGEVQLYYQSHQDQFTSPEKVHVAAIYQKVSPKAGAEQADRVKFQMEALRRQAHEQAAQQPHFGLLAQENSDDPTTRYQGGDCGFLTRASSKVRWDHTVREAAFALKEKGEISPVLRAPDGFYLLKLIERKSAETAPLDQVRERITRQLLAAEQKRAREKFETEQRRGLRVEINEPLLQSIKPPRALAKTNDAAPPGLPTP